MAGRRDVGSGAGDAACVEGGWVERDAAGDREGDNRQACDGGAEGALRVMEAVATTTDTTWTDSQNPLLRGVALYQVRTLNP